MAKTLSNNALEFKDITITLGGKEILKNISLPITRGKTTVLLGPSGAGKTTLLKLAVGLIKPDTGNVVAFGDLVQNLSKTALLHLRYKFGMLFQDGALFNSLSVFQNVAFPLFHHMNLKGQKLKDRVAELLSLVGLEGIEAQMPDTLSGGQRKRVGLARAIALNPNVVFFDEPTAGLDPLASDSINHLIQDLQHRLGTTFFIITHDIKSALLIGDYIGLLNKGSIHHFGNKNSILESTDLFVKDFIKNA